MSIQHSARDLTKRQLPQCYNRDVQARVAKQRRLLCKGDILQKKSRNAGVFNKYQKRFVWITPQGKDALKIMYWVNIKNVMSRGKVVASHDNLRKIAIEKKHFVALKNIKSITQSKSDKSQFDILTKTGLLIQFKTLDDHATRREWVDALLACKSDNLRYLLEFTAQDITSEVLVKDRVTGEWEVCVVVDYVVTEEQKKNNEPGYHVLAKENGMKFIYFKIDLLRTSYKMERGKNKSFAHERESREVENYKKLKERERASIRSSTVGPTPRLSIAARPPSNSVLNLPPPPLPEEKTQDVPESKTVTTTTVTTTTTTEQVRELRLIISRQRELIEMQEEEEKEYDEKLQKYADQIKDKDEEIEFLRKYTKRAKDPETVKKRMKMLEEDVEELKRQLELAYRDAEKWRKEAERLRAEMDAEVARKHEGANMDPPPRSRPPADQDKWAHYLLLFPPPPGDDEGRNEQPLPALPPMEEEEVEEKKSNANRDTTAMDTDQRKNIDELLLELEKEKESRRTVEAALRLAHEARNNKDDERYRLELENKEEELKEQVKALKASRSMLRIKLSDALKVANEEKEVALKKFADEHEKLEEAENERVRLQVEMSDTSLKALKLKEELDALNRMLKDSDERVNAAVIAEKKRNDTKLTEIEQENETLRKERSNLVLRLLETQKHNAKQKDELAAIVRLEKSAHAKDQERAEQLAKELQAKLAKEVAEQRKKEALTEDLIHRLETEKNQRLELEAELAAVRKAQFEHEGSLQRAAQEKEKELLSQQQTLKKERSMLRLELSTRLKAVKDEKESTDEELKRTQQAHIIALRDYHSEHQKLADSERTVESLRHEMEEAKRMESEMESQILALRGKLEDKGKLSKEEHDLLKEEHNNIVSKLLLQREEISSQKEQLATLLLLEKTAHQRDVETASVELEDLRNQLRNEELIIEQLKDSLRKEKENYEHAKEAEVNDLTKKISFQVEFCQKLQDKIKYLSEKEEKARLNAESEKAKSELEIQYLQDELAELSKKLASANDQHAKAKSTAKSNQVEAESERAKLLEEFARLHEQHDHVKNKLVLEQNKLIALQERDASLLARAHKLEKELEEKAKEEEENKKIREQLENNLTQEMVLNDKLRTELWTALHEKEDHEQLSQEEIDLAKKREENLKLELEESTKLLQSIRSELENQLHEERIERKEEMRLAIEKKEELLLEVKREKEQQQNLEKHLLSLKRQLEHEKSVEKAIQFDHHLTKNQLKRETAAVQKLLAKIRDLKRQQQEDLKTRERMRLEVVHVTRLQCKLQELTKEQEVKIGEVNSEKNKEIEVLKSKIAIGKNVIQQLKYDLNGLDQKIKDENLQNELLQNRIAELENSMKLAEEEIEREKAALGQSERSNAKLIHMLEMNKTNYHREIEDLKLQLQRNSKKIENYKERNEQLSVENKKNKLLQQELEDSLNKSEFEISLLRTKMEISINLVEELRYSNDQLQNELEKQRALSADLEQRLKEFEAQSMKQGKKDSKEISMLRQKLKEANQKVEKCNSDILAYEKQSKENNACMQKLKDIVENQNQDAAKQLEELKLLQRKIQISKNVITELRGGEEEYMNRINLKDDKLQKVVAELEEARLSAKQVKITLGRQLHNERQKYEKKLEEEKQLHVTDVEKIELKKKELQQQLEEGKGIQNMLSQRIDLLENEINDKKASVSVLQDKHAEMEEKFNEEVDINTKIREQLTELTEKSMMDKNKTNEEIAKLMEEKNGLEKKLNASNLKVEMMQKNLRDELEAEKKAHRDDLDEDHKRKLDLKHSLESSESVRRDLSNKLHEKEEYIEKIEREKAQLKTEAYQMEVAQRKLIEYLQEQLKEAEERLRNCDCHKSIVSGENTAPEKKTETLKVMSKKKDNQFVVNSKKKRVKQSGGRNIKKVVFSGGQGTAKGIGYYRGQW